MWRTVGLQSLTCAHEKMSSTLLLANFSKRFVLSLFVCWVKEAARFSVYLHCYWRHFWIWALDDSIWFVFVSCLLTCMSNGLRSQNAPIFPNIHTLIIFLWKIPTSKKENLCVCQPISQKKVPSVAPLWYQNWHCINFFFEWHPPLIRHLMSWSTLG